MYFLGRHAALMKLGLSQEHAPDNKNSASWQTRTRFVPSFPFDPDEHYGFAVSNANEDGNYVTYLDALSKHDGHLGYVSHHPLDNFHLIKSMYVKPAFRGKGLADEMMRRALQQIPADSPVGLHADPHADGSVPVEGLKKFYARHGFVDIGNNVMLRNPMQKTAADEYAPGIPDKSKIQPLPDIKGPTPWKFTVQEHHADRAGLHYDLRMVDPETGHAHSWALPKAKLPAPGEMVLAVQQPTHTKEYALNFGKDKVQNIEKGYGKGSVKMVGYDDADVYHSKPDESGTRMRFNLYKSTGPEEFVIVRSPKGQDMLINKTMTRKRLPHIEFGGKPKLRETEFHGVDLEDNTHVVMPKYDGAHTIVDLKAPGKIPRLYSYRVPKKHTAGVIEHTHKVPALLNTRTPKDLKGTTLRAETVAFTPGGKAIPASDIAGMLNATVHNSRLKQKELEAELRPVLLDVERYKGKSVQDMPYSQRYELLKHIGSQLKVPVTEAAFTAEDKKELLRKIVDGGHPHTTEGVVLRPLHVPGHAIKAKLRPDHDVYVREIFEAKKPDGSSTGRAGGFAFSWTPTGQIVGRVGTGFDHATLKDMLANPSRYKGRVAKVDAEMKTQSGALSKPSFIEWHLDKGDIEKR